MSSNDQKIITFLTFPGNAEDAMSFYVSLFSDGEILELTRYGEDDNGEIGKVLNGLFRIKGQHFMALDLKEEYSVPFSWATSLYVSCDDEKEFDHLFAQLSEGGQIIMGPESMTQYNLRKVAWVTDRFGVTWQPVFA
jgi:predicted 3-demethylubiquinone-9 3-methyltransferase (glyoxalase superfamily)